MRFLGKLGFQTPFHCFPMTRQHKTEMDLPLPHTQLVFSNTEQKARKIGLLLLRAEEVFHFVGKPLSSSQTGGKMNYYWAYLPNAPVCANPVNIKAAGIWLETESPLRSTLRYFKVGKEKESRPACNVHLEKNHWYCLTGQLRGSRLGVLATL